jgi:uncharacterized repeat protein (TIGR03803 family)
MTRPKPIFISYALAGGANFARKTWLRVDARFGSTDCAIRAAVFGSRKSRMRGRVCTRHQIWALNTNCGEGRAQVEILAEIPSYHDWWEILAGKLSESGRQSRKSNEGGGMSKLGLWRTVCLVCVFCAMGTIASSTQTFTTLVSFNKTNGANPGGLVQASDGNFYGTTPEGGTNTTSCYGNGCGTVFKITPGGTLTTLYSFCSKSGCTDGANPGGLIQATNGNFYGTTADGGTSSACSSPGCGTVFVLSVGLGPFVETRPTSGKVGAAVIILGNNLTGATSVTFNGRAAAFRVVSNTEITTMVPRGATTGPVKVKTPSGTLTSNVNFRVS